MGIDFTQTRYYFGWYGNLNTVYVDLEPGEEDQVPQPALQSSGRGCHRHVLGPEADHGSGPAGTTWKCIGTDRGTRTGRSTSIEAKMCRDLRPGHTNRCVLLARLRQSTVKIDAVLSLQFVQFFVGTSA